MFFFLQLRFFFLSRPVVGLTIGDPDSPSNGCWSISLLLGPSLTTPTPAVEEGSSKPSSHHEGNLFRHQYPLINENSRGGWVT